MYFKGIYDIEIVCFGKVGMWMYPDGSVVDGLAHETTDRRVDQEAYLHPRERLQLPVGVGCASDSKAEMLKT